MTNFLNRWMAASEAPRRPAFGERSRHEITPVAIAAVLAQWKQDGVPHGTRHHLRQALSQFYTVVNGIGGANPVKAVEWKRPKYREARAIDYAVIDRIFEQVPDYLWQDKKGNKGPRCKAKIVLRLEATTGLIPSMLNSLKPTDLNLKARTVFVSRNKGDGAEARTLRLIDEAIEPFKLFVSMNLFGQVRARSVARAWQTALEKAAAKWAKDRPGQPFPVPANCRPYDLRHSFGTAAYARTGDVRAVGELLVHAPGSVVTNRYVQAAVSKRATEAAKRIGKLFTGKRRASTRAA